MWERSFELLVELGGQGLVVRHDERGPVDRLDHLGHGKSLAGTGDAQQNLVLLGVEHAPDSGLTSHGLLTARDVVAD